MAIFIVKTTETRRDGSSVVIPFECEDIATIESFWKAIKIKPLIGFQLIYERISNDEKRIKGRRILRLSKDDLVGVEEEDAKKFR